VKANVSLASWPGLRHEAAAERLRDPPVEPVFGRLQVEHVQLVPQSFGMLSEDLVESLRAAHPATRFRLHANVRVLRAHRQADLSNFAGQPDWFEQAARVHRRLGAEAYTAHSGKRAQAGMLEMLDNARRCAGLFGSPVGVEGQYPTAGDSLLVSTWSEYRQLFESGVPYAIDLSHINIVAARSGERNEGLLSEMLACERCIEVHVSANDGAGDLHQLCDVEPWWFGPLRQVHPGAVIFSEGNHRRAPRQA
jgi:hypothetical protein